MRVPTNWIREYIDIKESPVELAERLTMAGLEVEEIHTEYYGLERSCVGRVDRVEEHPERPGFYVLNVACRNFSTQVLSNLRPFDKGELLPIAREGFVFPDGTVLEPRKITGVMSQGKILSEADVEYSSDDQVILPIPKGAEPGDRIPDLLDITSAVLKFDLTANRGDCLSVFGVCRELAAIYNRPLKKTPWDFTLETAPSDTEFTVDIKDPRLCPRYSGRLLQEIAIKESPVWMKRRLIACGMRPINGIVDVTNYVMLETGQPLHAFDLDTLRDRAIVVRRARKGESIITIDDQNRKLTTDMLVIADSKDPVAVAGVMGGALTEVSAGTKNLLLESAHFLPVSVRRTSMTLGLRSEASMRFEKGVDPTRAADSSDYAAFLMQKLGWGKVLDAFVDAYPRKYKPRTVSVSCKKIRDFLGEPAIDDKRMADVARRLDFEVIPGKTSAAFKVRVPGHRFDVSIWQDMAEEVARIYGYQNIRSELPAMKVHRARVTPNFAYVRSLKDTLSACGLSESITFSFANRQELKNAWLEDNYSLVPLQNPLTDDHTHLRPSLIPNMLKAVSGNLKRGNQDMALFELGKVFLGPGRPTEKLSVAVVLVGRTLETPTASSVKMNVPQYYEIKGVVEDFLGRLCHGAITFKKSTLSLFHPFRSASVFVNGVKVGELGEVHPEVCGNFDIRARVALAQLDPEAIRGVTLAAPSYTPFSRYPGATRDLSVVVAEEVEAAAIQDVITSCGGDILNSVRLVDVFRSDDVGLGKKSVTFALEFRHLDRTLGDDEVNAAVDRMVKAVQQKLGGALR